MGKSKEYKKATLMWPMINIQDYKNGSKNFNEM